MEVKATIHPNASSYKMKNKRILVKSLKNKNFAIQFKILDDKEHANKPKAYHICQRDVICITGIKLSAEAALCVFLGLKNELERAGIISVSPFQFPNQSPPQ
jgi:hypothetical protein